MKATIHFTEDEILIYGEDNTAMAVLPKEFLTQDCAAIQNDRSELEKLRLEAVIQKEAQEKYPEFLVRSYLGGEPSLNDKNEKLRFNYIGWWQSLIDRLPSEEEIKYEGKNYRIAEQGDEPEMYIENNFIEGANWLKSKLLPSLPSTLSCEYEEENGKIEVKKIWI